MFNEKMFQFELPQEVASWWEDDTGKFKETIGIEDIEDDDANIFVPDISGVDAESMTLMKIALGICCFLGVLLIWAWIKYGKDIERFYLATHGGIGLANFIEQQRKTR